MGSLRRVADLRPGAVPGHAEKTETAQYLITTTRLNDGSPAAPGEARKVMIRGRYQKREEIKTTAGDPLPEGQVWSSQPAEYVMIQNMETGKTITLFPTEKVYRIDQIIFGIDRDTQEVKQQTIGPMPKANFYKAARLVPIDLDKATSCRPHDWRPRGDRLSGRGE